MISIDTLYLKHTPDIIKPLAKDLIFDLPNDQNKIYLTFDDGPHPTVTPWVLDQLNAFDVKATFFLIGEHAVKYPDLVESIRSEGHAIGHHSQTHLSGWKTKDPAYFKDVQLAAQTIGSKLFRPPYGQITLSQANVLKQDFNIVMWSDLSADWDDQYTPEECAAFATRKVQSGSIIVFHDSEKAWPRLERALPMALEFYREKGFEMDSMS